MKIISWNSNSIHARLTMPAGYRGARGQEGVQRNEQTAAGKLGAWPSAKARDGAVTDGG